MKRPIEFRGKRVKDDTSINAGKWVHGSLVESLDGTFIFGYQARCMVKVDPRTIGQYTGLRDRYGTKVYEGDVIEMECDATGRVERGIVFWHKSKDEDYPNEYAPFEVFNVGWYVRVTTKEGALMDCLPSVIPYSEVVGQINVSYSDQ